MVLAFSWRWGVRSAERVCRRIGDASSLPGRDGDLFRVLAAFGVGEEELRGQKRRRERAASKLRIEGERTLRVRMHQGRSEARGDVARRHHQRGTADLRDVEQAE